MFKQVSENIVIVVNYIDPSIFSEKWYIKNGIFGVDDILDGKNVIAQEVSLVYSKNMYVQITHNQIAIFLQNFEYNEDVISKVKEIIEKIFKNNESSVIVACGINHNFETEEVDNTEAITKKLQFSQSLKLHQLLAGDNMRFGSYISKDFLNTRLRIDIKPFYSLQNIGKEQLKVNFNYHKAISNDKKMEELSEIVVNWKAIKENSSATVASIQEILNS